jgi:hypothetical protein
LAFFGRKKDEGASLAEKQVNASSPGETNGSSKKDEKDAPNLVIAPEKAKRFWDHAKTADQTSNYEYAMQLWLRGLRYDPTDLSALESFVMSAFKFNDSKNGKKGPSRETVKEFAGKDGINPYLSSLLAWATKPRESVLIVRATIASNKLHIDETTYWLAERAMAILASETKPRKSLCLQLMDVFSDLDAFEKAVECGELAVRHNPEDGQLAAKVKNLAAQAAMSKGGFDESGKEGGFRKNIRNLDEQQATEDEERIVKTEETIERMIKKEEHNLKLNPDDMPSLLKLVDLLKQRSAAGDEKRAFDLLNQAYTKTKEFRFRQGAGEIKLRALRRKMVARQEAAKANPDDEQAQQAAQTLEQEYNDLEIEEFTLRVKNYPTDLRIKFELGKRHFERGDYESAIALFQESQNEARSRVISRSYLGRSFLEIGWVDEAIQTIRDAMDVHKSADDDTGLELRYILLTALQRKAAQDRDLDAANEADKIASAIAIQQISYRDIRARREEIKKLIAELRSSA